ncbi:MAG: hypothetical protein K2R98_16265 [Gemmataceae bacterium]|nr:hypothetical protein [Gemmataceae bacterium]
MYRPSLGVWLSDDPIGFEGGQQNLYEFVGNNPTNATDPSGLTSIVFPLSDAKDILYKYTDIDLKAQDRQKAIRIRNATISAWIDEKSVYTAEEKKRVKDLIVQVMNAADFKWTQPTGFFGSCQEWAQEYETRHRNLNLAEQHKDYFRVTSQVFENKLVDARHATIRITFRDGTEIYLDDGNWGGLDRLFMPSEVGGLYTPKDAPDEWFLDKGFHRKAYVKGWFGEHVNKD